MPAPNVFASAGWGEATSQSHSQAQWEQFLHGAHLFCERGGGIREGRGSPDLCGTEVAAGVVGAVGAADAAGGAAGMYLAGGGIREGGDA